MTTREKKLTYGVGAAGLFALLAGGFLFVWQPIQDAGQQEAELQQAVADLDARLFAVEKDRPRLADALKRSLPADVDAAALEYEAVMSKLLGDADIRASGRTLKRRAVDLKPPVLNPAELDSKKQVPAFTAVGLDVTLKRVKYAQLLKVLYDFYRLNLLHQITRFNVKRVDDSGARKSGTGDADLPDLEVQFTTTAISLTGAENRRALLPVPPAAAAAAGGLGYAGVQQSPETARNLVPLQFAPVLATSNRQYAKLLIQDIFHGPPPPPPPVEVVREEVKEDTSPFIRLTGLGRNPDGTGSALIEDAASRNEYAVELTRPAGGRLTPVVTRFLFSDRGVRQRRRLDDPDATPDLLDISEASSGTARKFRVVGLADGGLVLASREAAKPADAGRRPRADDPAGAAAGPGATAPAEVVFLWRTGETLNKLKPLGAADARQAVQRATGEAADTVPTSAAVDTGR